MKFIDDKGKLFGKINIIDILVVLFIILILVVGLKFVLVKPNTVWITTTVIVKDQPYEVVDYLKEEVILGSSEEKIGEILAIYASPLDTKGEIVIYLNLSIEKKNNKFYFGDQELNINRQIKLNIGHVILDKANIISINKTVFKETKITVKALFKDIKPWFAENISKGDIELNTKDKIIAKIIDTEVSPASMITTSDTGEVYLREHPELKDIIVTFELIAKEKKNLLLFHNQELKINNNFKFYTEKYDLSGTIININ